VSLQFDALLYDGDDGGGDGSSDSMTVTGVTTSDYFTCGYSPAAIMLLMLMLVGMVGRRTGAGGHAAVCVGHAGCGQL
jgi:hypothetical protein